MRFHGFLKVWKRDGYKWVKLRFVPACGLWGHMNHESTWTSLFNEPVCSSWDLWCCVYVGVLKSFLPPFCWGWLPEASRVEGREILQKPFKTNDPLNGFCKPRCMQVKSKWWVHHFRVNSLVVLHWCTAQLSWNRCKLFQQSLSLSPWVGWNGYIFPSLSSPHFPPWTPLTVENHMEDCGDIIDRDKHEPPVWEAWTSHDYDAISFIIIFLPTPISRMDAVLWWFNMKVSREDTIISILHTEHFVLNLPWKLGLSMDKEDKLFLLLQVLRRVTVTPSFLNPTPQPATNEIIISSFISSNEPWKYYNVN